MYVDMQAVHRVLSVALEHQQRIIRWEAHILHSLLEPVEADEADRFI